MCVCVDDDVDDQQCSNWVCWDCVDFIMNDVLCLHERYVAFDEDDDD